MEKQNLSKCGSKQFTFRNPTDFPPSLPFTDTPGPSRVILSNVKRNLFGLRKRYENSKQLADKSVQTDSINDSFSPLLLEELEAKTNFLAENLNVVLKSLEPGLMQNILSAGSCKNRANVITSAGDVDSKAMAYPTEWSQPNSNNGSRILSEAEGTEINKYDMLKDKLNQILECASIIKNAIPTNLQHTSSQTNTDTLHMPTGVILTPTTQTEPVDTYVEFLEIIDEAAGFKSKLINSRNKSIVNPKSSRRTRMKISNRTHTVNAPCHQLKPLVKDRSDITDHKSGNHTLDIDLNETLSRRNSTDLDETLSKRKSIDLNETLSGGKSTDLNETLSRRKSMDLNETMSKRTSADLNETLSRKKSIDFDANAAEIVIDNTEWPSEPFVKTCPESQPNVGSLSHRPLKITKFLSADAIISTHPDEKNFCLKHYVSTLRQVHVRSPATKRIREFSMRSRKYFDFDDYYERLIRMREM